MNFVSGAPLNERNRVEVLIDDQGLYREKQVHHSSLHTVAVFRYRSVVYTGYLLYILAHHITSCGGACRTSRHVKFAHSDASCAAAVGLGVGLGLGLGLRVGCMPYISASKFAHSDASCAAAVGFPFQPIDSFLLFSAAAAICGAPTTRKSCSTATGMIWFIDDVDRMKHLEHFLI